MVFVGVYYMEQGTVMGKTLSRVFEKEQLEDYTQCTFFTENEILKLYKKFSSLNPEKINPLVGDGHTRLTFGEVRSLMELRECPFALRLCEVFSTDNEGINFEDFLDMMSVFSDRAPWTLKATYAFKIFDFNNDSNINVHDIRRAIRCITGTNYCVCLLESKMD